MANNGNQGPSLSVGQDSLRVRCANSLVQKGSWWESHVFSHGGSGQIWSCLGINSLFPAPSMKSLIVHFAVWQGNMAMVNP